MSTSEPVLSLAEAARACGVSVSTVRRRLTRLTEHGATRHATSWRIPISALVAEGMMPRVTPPDTSSHDTVTRSMTRHRDTPLTRPHRTYRSSSPKPRSAPPSPRPN